MMALDDGERFVMTKTTALCHVPLYNYYIPISFSMPTHPQKRKTKSAKKAQ